MTISTRQLINASKKTYYSFTPIYCKPIKYNVIFNKRGWRHFIFQGNGRKREDKNIRMRLYLLPFIPEIIRNAISAKQDIVFEQHGGKSLTVTYTTIKGIVDDRKKYIGVTIRKLQDGTPHYYSVKLYKLLKKRV